MLRISVKVIICFTLAETTLLARPKDAEVVMGSTAYFRCQTNEKYNINWDHVPLGGSGKRKEVYIAGTIISPYDERYTVEIDRDTGSSILVITDVQRENAGTYECTDRAGLGERHGAELVVLESPPNCEYLSNYVMAVGENDCGVEPDVIQFRCRLKYYGNSYPILEWKVTEGSEIKPETAIIERLHHQVNFTVLIKPTKEVNQRSYSCETRASRIKWTSEKIHVLYAHNSHKRTVTDHAGWHRCTANSNLPCKYKWTVDTDDGEDALLTTNQTAYIQSSGHHVCHAICNLRGHSCTIHSRSVQLNLKGCKFNTATKALSTLLLLLVLASMAGYVQQLLISSQQ